MLPDLKSFRALIFDCDGILVDSEPVKFQAWQEAFRRRGIELHEDEYRPYCGHAGPFIYNRICKKKGLEPCPELYAERRAVFKELHAKGVVPISHGVHFLNQVVKHKNRYKIGLVSSASRKEIMRNLQMLGVEKSFDIIVSGADDLAEYIDPTGTNKPKPYIYLKATNLLGVPPEECMVFEDTEAGVSAAHSAGCYVVAVPTDFTSCQNFKYAKKRLSSLSEISLESHL